MIRGAVLHLNNEQPLVVDLTALPTAADACVVCTNVRDRSGKPPRFIDSTESTFLFPLVHIRFLEIPAESLDRQEQPLLEAGDDALEPVEELELDEDFLRRIREA